MGQKCKVCQLIKDRHKIDKALVRGESILMLSREHGVSETSLRNHKKNCLSRQLLKSEEIKSFFDSQGLIQEVSDIIKRTKNLLDKAEQDKKFSAAFSGIAQWRGALEFLTNFAIRLKELEIEEEEKDAPLNIKVTVTEKDGRPLLSEPEPKKETHYVRNKGKPKGTPEPVPILEDDIDYNVEPEVEDEPEIEYTEMGGDIDWEKEKAKERRRMGWRAPRKSRRPKGDNGLSDAIRAGRVRVSRNI